MPRFVILTHDWPFWHWDLMLESEGKLLSWRLLQEPDVDQRIEAERLPDHRIEYLDYEGPVSNNRGTVRRWERGDLLSLKFTDQLIVAEVRGNRFCGEVVIREHPLEPKITVEFINSSQNPN